MAADLFPVSEAAEQLFVQFTVPPRQFGQLLGAESDRIGQFLRQVAQFLFKPADLRFEFLQLTPELPGSTERAAGGLIFLTFCTGSGLGADRRGVASPVLPVALPDARSARGHALSAADRA